METSLHVMLLITVSPNWMNTAVLVLLATEYMNFSCDSSSVLMRSIPKCLSLNKTESHREGVTLCTGCMFDKFTKYWLIGFCSSLCMMNSTYNPQWTVLIEDMLHRETRKGVFKKCCKTLPTVKLIILKNTAFVNDPGRW